MRVRSTYFQDIIDAFKLAIDDVENEKKLQRAFRKIDQDGSGATALLGSCSISLIGGLSKEEFCVVAREILPRVVVIGMLVSNYLL